MEAKRVLEGAVLLQAFLFVVNSNASRVSPSPLAVGVRGYRRFHANDSYIGKSIPCTYEEKLCFRYNTLYLPTDGICLWPYYDRCNFVGDGREFLTGSGRLFAMCPGYYDPCTDDKYRMAYDGRCYPKQVVRDVLCGCAAEPTPYFLGWEERVGLGTPYLVSGVECRCSPPRPIQVQQPRETGRCRIPDLRFPDNKRDFLYRDPKALRNLAMQCSAAQAECFSKQMVAVREYGSCCYRLHERGPCPPDHVVALDREAALASRAEGTCVHVRGGCPHGQNRLAFDERCHKDGDMKILALGHVEMTEDGRLRIKHATDSSYFQLATLHISNNGSLWYCLLRHKYQGAAGQKHYTTPPCSVDNRGGCKFYEVEVEVPLPDLD